MGLSTFQDQIDEKMMKNIVVVGGGAGGLEFITQLAAALKKNDDVSITLIDKLAVHMWKPLLHEVALGTLNIEQEQTHYFLHAKKHGYRFIQAELYSIDRESKTIQIKTQHRTESNELVNHTEQQAYDVLVLALGSKSNDFGTPGVREHCYFLDDIEQAQKIHQDMMFAYQNSPQLQQEPVVNIAIIGGGATGVEFAAELAQVKHTLFDYGFEKIRPENIHIHVIEGGSRILNALSEQVSERAETVLSKLKVNLLTNHRVKSIEHQKIHFADGTTLHADCIIWAAGVKAPKVLEQLNGFEKDGIHRLKVHATLQTFTDPHVFAFGDCAHCQLDSKENPLGARAQVASQQAEFLVNAVLCHLKGKTIPMFKFNEKGTLVSLSNLEAVGQILGNSVVQGASAKMLYRSLYRVHQSKIHGVSKALLITAKDAFARQVNPRIKFF